MNRTERPRELPFVSSARAANWSGIVRADVPAPQDVALSSKEASVLAVLAGGFGGVW